MYWPNWRALVIQDLLELGCVVVARSNVVTLILGDAVDQRKSLSDVFGLAPCVPGNVESHRHAVVSHREIRIERDGALKQRNSS